MQCGNVINQYFPENIKIYGWKIQFLRKMVKLRKDFVRKYLLEKLISVERSVASIKKNI